MATNGEQPPLKQALEFWTDLRVTIHADNRATVFFYWGNVQLSSHEFNYFDEAFAFIAARVKRQLADFRQRTIAQERAYEQPSKTG